MDECAPLTTAEFRQTLLPDTTQLYFDLEAIHQILVIWRLQFRKIPGEKLREYASKVPAKKKKAPNQVQQ
jgi:hypothetical protein